MAISKLEVGVVPLGVGGDSLRSAAAKINANFEDPNNAASKLIGTGAEQVPLSKNIPSLLGTAATKNVGTAEGNVVTWNNGSIGASGIGGVMPPALLANPNTTGLYYLSTGADLYGGGNFALHVAYTSTIPAFRLSNKPYSYDFYLHGVTSAPRTLSEGAKIYHDKNTTIVNGSLKPSSPVVKIHTDSLELNDDAERMGVTLNKRGVGDYLLQNTTGLRNDGGWRIELPQDVNGNPYFAVAYNELENNDIEVKTYKRIFDMNTFMFGPDLENPVDIKEGRSIAIRFNDLLQDDTQTEV